MFAFISLRQTPQSVFCNFLFFSTLTHAHYFLSSELGLLKFKAAAVFTPLWCAHCVQVSDPEGTQIHPMTVPDAVL